MKALIKKSPESGIWLEEVPVPEFGNNDLLIKIQKTAICGTDVHIYNWDAWAQRTIRISTVIGHEFVGEVVDKGMNVSGFHIGDRVSGEGHIVCGICRSCKAGRRHLCTNAVGIGVNRDGCFAEYMAFPASNAWHVHPSISSETAAYFDPYGNATHATLSFDLVGEDVLITGAGPIGIISTAIARHVGARNIVITDVNDYRLKLAEKMGATRAVNVNQTTIEDCRVSLGMIGFDIGLEMSGNAGAFESMLENMYHGGRIALLGILPKMASIDWDQVIFKGLNIKGIYGREIFETWYKMETMLQSGLDISHVLTHKFPFEDFQKGFDVMRSGQCGKVILEF
ncbi:L-threonine 3-dehydrogenase [bacterium]|nr:L-threonine 3-dehydrogenase [bacterium]